MFILAFNILGLEGVEKEREIIGGERKEGRKEGREGGCITKWEGK